MSHAPNRKALFVPTARKRVGVQHNGVQGTPAEIYDWLEQLMPFTVDVCANEENAKHPRFFSETENGLSQSWGGETFFCNPPYGRIIGEWTRKGRDACIFERAFGCFVVPARVDAAWWRMFVMQGPDTESDEPAAGELLRSFYDPVTRVHFYRWERLVTAVYFHDQRIAFENEARQGKDEHGAPFPSAFVFMGSTNRVRPLGSFGGPKERDLLARWPR